MKRKHRLVKGIKVHLFYDWENEKDLIGEGTLIRKVKEGLPFIITDIDTDGTLVSTHKQVTYSYEE